MDEISTIAGIYYSMKASHNDGSCDDYYPYERALGAIGFSIYTETETYLLLDLNDDKLISYFNKRGKYILNTINNNKVNLCNCDIILLH